MFTIIQVIARVVFAAIAAGTIVRVSDNLAGRKPYPPYESANGKVHEEVSVG